jgi:hypothetical protein
VSFRIFQVQDTQEPPLSSADQNVVDAGLFHSLDNFSQRSSRPDGSGTGVGYFLHSGLVRLVLVFAARPAQHYIFGVQDYALAANSTRPQIPQSISLSTGGDIAAQGVSRDGGFLFHQAAFQGKSGRDPVFLTGGIIIDPVEV